MTTKETAVAPSVTPVRVQTASSKKLALSPSSLLATPGTSSDSRDALSVATPLTDCDPVTAKAEMSGYHLVRCQTLASAIREVGKCRTCESPLTVGEELGCRRGLVSRLSLQCSNPDCSVMAHLTDPYSDEVKALNCSSVVGMRMVGRGRSSLETFCAVMDMLPPLTRASYSEHNSHIHDESTAEAVASQQAASMHLHNLNGVPHEEVLDVCVTCDGTWSKRGFTALYGVVVVVSWDSGQVLDCELVSKYCPESTAYDKLSKDSDEPCDCGSAQNRS